MVQRVQPLTQAKGQGNESGDYPTGAEIVILNLDALTGGVDGKARSENQLFDSHAYLKSLESKPEETSPVFA